MNIIEDFLGNGIFISDGVDWEHQHKMIRQIFSPEKLQQTNSIILNETDRLMSEWEQPALKGKPTDIETPIHYMMLRILFKAQIVQNDDYDSLRIFNAFQQVMQYVSFRKSIRNFIVTLGLGLVGYHYRPQSHRKTVGALESLVDELIAGLQSGKYQQGSLTQILITKYELNEITYKDVRDTIMNFIFAGFETTAAALTWTLFCLARYPDEQRAVQKEIDESHTNGDTEYNYLKLVVKEAMRFYPPVWFYLRECLEEDETLEPYIIRKGTLLMFCPNALHQHPDYWQNPESFNPHNFDKENIAGKSFVYIPFGQGKRTCIGQAFANMQLNFILVQLLTRFSISLASENHPRIDPAIIIKGATPVQLILKKR